MPQKAITPNHREILAAQSTIGGTAEYLTSTLGILNVNATVTGTISGAKTNNTAVPGATNLGTLPAIATVASPSYTEGFQVGLSTDLAGALRVTGSITVGGTTDNSAFTAGSSTGTPTMGFYHASIDTVTDGRAAAVGITSKRAMMVNLQTAVGVETGVAAAPLQVSLANTGANSSKLLVTADAITFASPQHTIVDSGSITLAAGTAIAGKVGIDQTTPGTTNGVAVAQIGATTVATGNGVVGAGVQRIAIASDNTAFSVNATLSAETTKVIGVTRSADGAGNLLTSTGQALDINLKTIASALTLANVTTVGTITNTVTTSEAAPTTIYNGKKTVTTAGTRVTLASSQAVKTVTIKALMTNTGIIYVGDGSVSATTGIQLYAGEPISFDIANLATVNIDSSVNGEGVTYLGTN